MKKTKNGFIFRKIVVLSVIVLGSVCFIKEVYFEKGLSVNHLNTKVLASNNLPNNPKVEQLQFSEPTVTGVASEYNVRIPVLMYHYIRNSVQLTDEMSNHLTVTPEQLDKQFKYLYDNGYQTISLNDLLYSLENKEPLPTKSVIITFDDGYRDFYTNAFPIIKKYNFRVVSFYIAGYLNYPGYMDLNMLKEVHQSGLVDVQSHTMTHPMLTTLPPEQIKAELVESKNLLQNTLNKKVNFLAYPYGDYNDQVVSLVQEAGYKLAFNIAYGEILNTKERFFLRRIGVSNSDTLETFKTKMQN